MVGCWGESSRGMLTGVDKRQHIFLAHSWKLSHEVHGCQSPVDSTNTEELQSTIVL